MIELTASALIFFAIATGAFALFYPGPWKQQPIDERIRSLVPNQERGRSAGGSPLASRTRMSPRSLIRRLLSASTSDQATELQQANIRLRTGEYVLLRALLATAAFLLPVLISGMHPAGLMIGVAGAVAGFLLPPLYVKAARHSRITKIERQLVEFLPLLASALRSGFALQQSFETAGRQIGAPLGDEIALLINDINLGESMPDALEDLGRRIGSTDLQIVITAILVQRSTGGNLAEVLDNAAQTLRERERIRGEVQTLTAQQRLTGVILSVYPVVIWLVLLALMPSMWSKLFTETAGQVMLAIAIGLQLLGFFAIRRVTKIEY